MQIMLLDFNQEFGHLRNVESARIMYRNKFDPKGLFSEQIFGPEKNYKCQCGKYEGREYANEVCEQCGVLISSSSLRLTTFAKIDVPSVTAIVNPILADVMMQYAGPDFKNFKLMQLLHGEKAYAVNEQNEIESVTTEDKQQYSGPLYFRNELYPWLKSNFDSIADFDAEYGDKLFVNVIPVIPPDTRPISKTDSKTFYSDEINGRYNMILRTIYNMKAAPFLFERNHITLQKQYSGLCDVMLRKFGSKNGFLRGHVLGKRIDYSGRAVIVVDGSNMPLGWCKLPFSIAREVYKPEIIKPLAIRKKMNPLKVIYDYDKAYMQKDIMALLKEMYIGSYVILNRQPTLHRPSMMSSRIFDIIYDDVIVIHPLICNPYNADFDGDQMAVYVPNLIGESEAVNKMWLDKNSQLPSSGDISFKFSQDMVLGLNNMTKSTKEKEIYLGVDSYPGRVELFKSIIPSEYQENKELFQMFNITMDSKTIAKLIDTLFSKIPQHKWMSVIDSMSRQGFKHSRVSVSLKDFIVPDKASYTRETAPINVVTDMIRSGARGSFDQYEQLAVSKGSISDVTGKVLPHKIENSLIDGLSRQDYFTSCYGGRKGLIDTAENTATSGYMTRKLIYLMSPLIMDKHVKDCHETGDKAYLDFYVENENIAKMLIYRYTDQGLITKTNYKALAGKTIKLRSPITCSCKTGICKKCYGELYKIHNSRMIGIIAAQSLGERTTQLTLRTKHTAGGATDSLGDLKKYIDYDDGYLIAKEDGELNIEDSLIVFTFDSVDYILDSVDSFTLLLKESHPDQTLFPFTKGNSIAKATFTNTDIVSAVLEMQKLLSSPPFGISIQDYIYRIIGIYGNYASINMVHFELIFSILARNIEDPTKPYRWDTSKGYQFMGLSKAISNMPEQALAFERFSFHIKKYLRSKPDSLAEGSFSLLKSLLYFKFDGDDDMGVETSLGETQS